MKKILILLSTINFSFFVQSTEEKVDQVLKPSDSTYVISRNVVMERDLIVAGDETIQGNLKVLGTPYIVGNIELIGTPKQACIIFVDAKLHEKARICSSSTNDKGIFISIDGGYTKNIHVNNVGGVSVAKPVSGVSLTVSGDQAIINGDLSLSAGNLIIACADQAGTKGLIKLGSEPININLYEVGTRNLFIGNGDVNDAVTGSDNISIGTNANATLMAVSNTIALGNTASANAQDSIALGGGASANAPRTIVIGSKDFISTGGAPRATNTNAIAVGSGSSANAGAQAAGISAIAIGGADGTFAGANVSGARSIGIGLNANSSAVRTIVIGSASGVTGGSAPTAGAANSIAIGSASGEWTGASAAGVAAIALGGSDNINAGAYAGGARSVALGSGARTSQADAIILGNANSAAVKVGVGTNVPSAKLHIVGDADVPVIKLIAGSAALKNAPVLANLVAGSLVDVLSINAANQIFRVASSKRFKENFRSIDDLTAKIYCLNPLMFDYKQENGGAKDHIGFTAEEVAQVFPSLVNYDDDGTPRSIKYECFHALAIKEIQKHKQQLDKQENTINQLAAIIQYLQTRIAALENTKNQ